MGKQNNNIGSSSDTEKVTSLVFIDDCLVEMVIDESDGKSKFAVYKDGEVKYQEEFDYYLPWSSSNGLITSEAMFFPSKAKTYGNAKKLYERIIQYLKSYIMLPEHFYEIVAVYIMMTWVYDQFSEVAYLRIIGDFGTGKTRFIKTVSHICYKPMIGSGSVSQSALFRFINAVGGTFVFDEADFKGNDIWSEIIKILNSGHTKGTPVLKSKKSGVDGEWEPEAFKVFGPKILASRERFADAALESRCVTEELIPRKKLNVPIDLDKEFEREALKIRNRLLMFRFENFNNIPRYEVEQLNKLDPRMQQTALCILSVAKFIGDDEVLDRIIKFLEDYNDQLRDDRGDTQEVDVLLVIGKLMFAEGCISENDPHHSIKNKGVKIAWVSNLFNESFKHKYDIQRRETTSDYLKNHLTPKMVGEIIRKKLRIKTRRQKGGYCIPFSEAEKIKKLMSRYALSKDSFDDIKCGTHS